VDSKIQQEQLDEAPVTLQEIGIMKLQFHKVLGGVYHHRIDYPATRHLTELKPSMEEVSPEPGRAGGDPTAVRVTSSDSEASSDVGKPAAIDDDA